MPLSLSGGFLSFVYNVEIRTWMTVNDSQVEAIGHIIIHQNLITSSHQFFSWIHQQQISPLPMLTLFFGR